MDSLYRTPFMFNRSPHLASAWGPFFSAPWKPGVPGLVYHSPTACLSQPLIISKMPMYVLEGLPPSPCWPAIRRRSRPSSRVLNARCDFINVSSGRVRVELQHYLQKPKSANTLRVMLPHGTMVQGLIIDGCNEPTGGWWLINVEQHNLSLVQPDNLRGWQ